MNPDCEVWPENWDAVRVFEALRTQWRHGLNGPTGLVYSEIPGVLSFLDVSVEGEEKQELFISLRVMEGAALGQIATNQRQQR